MPKTISRRRPTGNRRTPGLLSRAATAVKRRYFRGSGYTRPRIFRIIRDVNTLRNVINAEKKRIESTVYDQPVGQVNINADGNYIVDITPVASQGTTISTRTGSSIKVSSFYASFQFRQMSNTSGPIKGTIYFIRNMGPPFASLTSPLQQFMEGNQWIANANGGAQIRDYTSDRNPDYYRNFRVLKRKNFYVKDDPLTSAQEISQFNMGMKLYGGKGMHVRYQDNTTGLANGQIFMLVVLNNGNCSTGSASTLNSLAVTAANTGLYMSYNVKWYYYDN